MIELIPAIDLLNGRVVRLEEGNYAKVTDYGSPFEWAKYWLDQGAKKIHVVDLDGAKEGKLINLRGLEQILSTGIQVEFGGGVRTWETIEDLFELGVRFTILGTVAVKEPELMIKALKVFTNRIILALDTRDDKVSVSGWLEESEITVEDLLKKLSKYGLSRFIYTDINKDGMLNGPNIEGAVKLCSVFPRMKCILSGGVSSLDDLLTVEKQSRTMPNLDGIISGKALMGKRFDFRTGQSIFR